jgi:hypothetical protein
VPVSILFQAESIEEKHISRRPLLILIIVRAPLLKLWDEKPMQSHLSERKDGEEHMQVKEKV